MSSLFPNGLQICSIKGRARKPEHNGFLKVYLKGNKFYGINTKDEDIPLTDSIKFYNKEGLTENREIKIFSDSFITDKSGEFIIDLGKVKYESFPHINILVRGSSKQDYEFDYLIYPSSDKRKIKGKIIKKIDFLLFKLSFPYEGVLIDFISIGV